ncbi:hypothetical protein [Novosphingobium sp. AAP83]|nr:hypothetical protein [Novosphingobium sp. AAP83]
MLMLRMSKAEVREHCMAMTMRSASPMAVSVKMMMAESHALDGEG